MAGAEGHAGSGRGGLAETGQLVVDGESDAQVASFPPETCLLAPKRLVPDRLDHLLETHGVARAVVDQPRGRRVRQISRTDQVDAPDLDGIEPELPRAEIQHAFHHERGGRTSHAAVRACGRGVRRHRGHLAAVVRELVGTGQEPTGHERLEAGGPRIDGVGAGVAGRSHVHGKQSAAGIESGPHGIVVVARVR